MGEFKPVERVSQQSASDSAPLRQHPSYENWYDGGLEQPSVAEMPYFSGFQTPLGQGAATETMLAQAVPKPYLTPRPVPSSRPPLRVIPGGGLRPATPAIGAVGALRFLNPLAAFLSVLLTPSPTAPPWKDEISQVTGLPYRDREQYERESQLTQEQIQRLREVHASNQESSSQQENQPEALPGEGLEPPGDCTPSQYQSLRDDVERLCKNPPRSCNQSHTPEELDERIENNARCIDARARINSICFRGGDRTHRDELNREIDVLMKCYRMKERMGRTR